jgi:VanZ family protein
MRKTAVFHGLFYGLPVLAYAGLIFILSSISRLPETVPSFVGFDKLAHGIEYYLFGCLILRWFLARRSPPIRPQAAWLTLAVGIIYALSDEWHQSFVPGRDATLWDVLADSGGLLLASTTYRQTVQKVPFLRKMETGIERICRHEA